MRLYEFKRIYHPILGTYVYQHKGSGLIVDNIFKPTKKLLSTATQTLLKPLAKKALKSGIEHAGDKIGRRAAEKAGQTIMKRLHSTTKPTSSTKKVTFGKPATSKPKQEDYNVILNRLISGNGY